MKITIKLLSDLCTCSGETYNSVVDMDVVYDENGIPYIPAKRIKGCIREAALEMKEMGFISEAQYESVFGKEGNTKSKLILSSAYIQDYENIVESLKYFHKNELVSQQNVLEQYTSTRTQTAVDLETGVADENSLRTIRVVNKGLVFEAECELKMNEADRKVVEQAVSLVKHMGVSRTRGLGLVEMKLEDGKKKKAEHVLFKKDQLSDKNKIGYKIHLKSPMICKSAKGNQADTENYIAGSKVLGLLAGALKEKYSTVLDGGELIVSNAYIMNKGQRCLPGKISLQKVKDQRYDSDGKMVILDMQYEPDTGDRQMTPANLDFVDKDGVVADVITEISYHHQRPVDKSIGRATGEEDGSSFYQMASISAGQDFYGYIYANKVQAEALMDAMAGTGNVRMGYGKSSEFGAVDFVFETVEKIQKETVILHDAVITLASDIILYNENGVPTTEIGALKRYLENMTETFDLEITHPFLNFVTIGGFNVSWNRRKPIFNALGKGSTFRLHSERGFDAGRLRHEFIGERVSEGYGEIQVKELAETAEVTVWKNAVNVSETEEIKNDHTGIMQKLLQAEFERRVQSYVRETLNQKKGIYQKKGTTLNAAIAKLRILFRTEQSYADMKKQIRGIEATEKNGLCTGLVQLVVPDQLKEEISKQMRQEYQIDFHTQLSENALYKMVYRAYITELKQFVRTIEKGGESK